MDDVDDIEDLISSVAGVAEIGREKPRNIVSLRSKVKGNLVREVDRPSPQVPGTQTIFIKTWGCSHNSSDGEYMAGLLSSYGYKITGMINIVKFAPNCISRERYLFQTTKLLRIYGY